VKMRVTRDWTKRPRGALLYPGIGLRLSMCRIGGRLGDRGASLGGANGEIPLLLRFGSNHCASRETVSGG
jgi:hypothetical protein